MIRYISEPTQQLEGSALDYAVVLAVGGAVSLNESFDGGRHWEAKGLPVGDYNYRPRIGWIGSPHPSWPGDRRWNPSTSWSQGGGLIDRFDVDWIEKDHDDDGTPIHKAICMNNDSYLVAGGEGPTRLIAAMRAIVAAYCGQIVSIPAPVFGISGST